jgi:hypothetical protein
MSKLSMLTTLNAIDPLPRLGAKVTAQPTPTAEELRKQAVIDFERIPHELSSQQPGRAGSGSASPYTIGAFVHAVTRSNTRAAELLRPILPDGNQRYSREGELRGSDTGRYEARDRADSGNTGCGISGADFSQIEARILAQQKHYENEARRAGPAGSVVISSGRRTGRTAADLCDWTRGLNRIELYNKFQDLLDEAPNTAAGVQLRLQYDRARNLLNAADFGG